MPDILCVERWVSKVWAGGLSCKGQVTKFATAHVLCDRCLLLVMDFDYSSLMFLFHNVFQPSLRLEHVGWNCHFLHHTSYNRTHWHCITLTSIPYACKTLSSRFDSSSADKLEMHSQRSSTVSVRVDWSSSHVLTVSNGHVLMLLWLFILNCFQKWRAETVEPGHLIRNPISWLSNRLIKLPKQIGRVSLADWLYNWGFYLMQPDLAKAPIIWLSLSLCHIHTLTNTEGE